MASSNLPIGKVGSVPFHIWVVEGQSGLDVRAEPRIRHPTRDLDVLQRHRPRSISRLVGTVSRLRAAVLARGRALEIDPIEDGQRSSGAQHHPAVGGNADRSAVRLRGRLDFVDGGPVSLGEGKDQIPRGRAPALRRPPVEMDKPVYVPQGRSWQVSVAPTGPEARRGRRRTGFDSALQVQHSSQDQSARDPRP